MGKCKFNENWLDNPVFAPWLVPVKDVHEARCKLCKKYFKLGTMGVKAVESHMQSAKHKSVDKTTSISHFCSAPACTSAAPSQCKMESDLTEMKIGFIGAGNMAFGIAQGILMSGKVNRENVKVSAPSSNNLGRFQCKMESDLTEMKIGFIGAGNMAFGIAQGILMSGKVNPENVKVSAPSSNNLGRFQELGVAVTHSNSEVVTGSRLVFMAVKPHLVPTVLCEIAPFVTQQHVIVSVAAGITLATLEGLLPPDSVVMRLMPNLPCMVQEGALLFSRGSRARPEDGSLLRGLLTPCGLVEEGPETWIDAHTGLSGSGVAFVYLFAEALAEGGVKMGMPSALAHRIAAQTVLGAGRLLRDSGKHPAQLRSDVCTPGGTTIFGLHELERGGLRATTMGAVEAATERARELGKK
ncbi:hypothetical protein AAFF_G00124320 [Aldrovandia affinis]|uniref:Pyrroline-5-carboxylate reductase n=1 Tax=Aldrovandia affinis TaxID=143900 RepID=A0AAD7RRR1_9TELE|nr:hypothetical protein AAFF_G00124320 [Aldrovandia affinis]